LPQDRKQLVKLWKDTQMWRNRAIATRLKAVILLVFVAGTTSFLVSQKSTPRDNTSSSSPPIAAAITQVTTEDINSRHTVSSSIWQQRQRQKALGALVGSDVDVLVVPFQSSPDGHEFDASARSLLTLISADTLSKANIEIADPITVAQAIGLNRSTFEFSEIAEVAKQVGAKKVLVSFIHHDNNKLSLELELYERSAGQSNGNVDWSQYTEIDKVSRTDISFDSVQLPYLLYKNMHQELLEDLFEIEFQNEKTSSDSYAINPVLPVSDFFSDDAQSPIETVKKLQFLALLHPHESTERSGRWLYERSLVELENMQESAAVNLLKATALVALNRRPAALNLLESVPDGSEKNALLEYVNGNLVNEESIKTIKDPVDRISALIRNKRLGNTYGLKASDSILEELSSAEPWQHLIANAVEDGYVWRNTGNSYLKDLLDKIKPVERLSYGSIMTRLTLSRSNTADASLEQSILDHLETLDTGTLATSLGVRQSDLANLVRVQLAENIYDRIYIELFTRGRPEVALEFVTLFEPILEGQPDFSLITSETYKKLSSTENLGQAQAKKYLSYSESYGLAGFLHANSRNKRTKFSGGYLKDLHKHSRSDQERLTGVSQWPFAACLPTPERLEHCLDNTITEFTLLINTVWPLLESDIDSAKVILATNHHRFIGNEARLDYLYTTYQQIDHKDGIELIEQELAQSGNTDWSLLKRIADTARLDSRFDEAADIILRYPEFDDNKNIDNVKASNRSFDIGSRMYWAGARQAATELYKKTISRNTGSNAELSAHARLATLEGDYMQAAQIHYERIQRYHSPHAMRDLLGLLSLFSGGEEALNLSYSLTPFMAKPEVWHGSLMAHRANDSTMQQQVEWLESGLSAQGTPSSSQSAELQRYANSYLMMMAFIDRKVESESVAHLLEFSKTQKRRLYIPDKMNTSWTSFPGLQASPEASHWLEKVFMPSQTAAAQVLEFLYNGEFKQAETLLNEQMLCHGDVGTEEFLWLCAWTASQSERASPFSENLESMIEHTRKELRLYSDPKGRLFDQYISLALLNGFAGRHEEAMDLLYLANADHRYTEGRSLLVRYHTLEVARILFEATEQSGYKSFVLEHAHKFTITDPIAAYNYSFIAMLSDNQGDRVSALASLIQLDPQSRAMTTANVQELKEAAKEMESNRSALTQNHGKEI